jgi:hypothetical protein
VPWQQQQKQQMLCWQAAGTPACHPARLALLLLLLLLAV